jgi:cardiolipin synthase (CMP-forming)
MLFVASEDSSSGTRGGPEEPLDRILTVPNAITTLRLACVPLFCWLLFGAHRQSASAVLLAVLGATDFLDGYAARRWGQVSRIGKILDPTADRILVATAVISVTVQGAVPIWFAVATIAREAIVSGTVVLLGVLGAERIDVLWVGKAGTFGLMFAYPAFLLAHGTSGWQHPIEVLAWVGGVAGLALAWIAAFLYIPTARVALSAGRAARAASRSAVK